MRTVCQNRSFSKLEFQGGGFEGTIDTPTTNVREKPLVSSLLAGGIGKKIGCNLITSARNW